MEADGPLKSGNTKVRPQTACERPAPGRTSEALEAPGTTHVQQLQRLVGNHVVAGLLQSNGPLHRLVAQRGFFKEGSNDQRAAAVPAAVKGLASWVLSKTSVQPGGSNYIANVQQSGLPGFKKGREEYVGGSAYQNHAMPDGSRLPYSKGETYQEWDTVAYTGARGAARLVTSSSGKVYYTVDHYANFTELAA
jgi:guanyl-specific ribonuclease Sa